MSDDSSGAPKRIDAMSAICADLDDLKSHRRRHFTPALIMSVAAVGLIQITIGLRSDLWQQPWWQVALQVASWVVCLIVFPAIGIGLWFPSRLGRVALVGLGIGLSVVAALGWPAMPSDGSVIGGPCGMVLLATAFVLLGIGALSGAFSQRRCTSAVYWIAGGVTLAGLNLVTWMCGDTSHDHVLLTHLLPAAVVIGLASVLGSWLRRRAQR